jgi:hypothetical protein
LLTELVNGYSPPREYLRFCTNAKVGIDTPDRPSAFSQERASVNAAD